MSKVERHTAGTPSWLDLMTPDAEKARAFYGKLFGWEFLVGPAEAGFYSMATKAGQMVAGLGPLPKDAQYPTCWTVYFDTESADATCAKIKEAGGTVMMGPMDVLDVGRMAVCMDNNGAPFGLWQAKKHTGAQLVDEVGTMCWNEVYVRDAAKARDFYLAVFGLESKKIEGAEYWTLHRGPEARCGIMAMDKSWPDDVPQHWRNYFCVANTEASCQLIKELGGKVVMPPFDSPHGKISAVEDPFGAIFSIISSPPK